MILLLLFKTSCYHLKTNWSNKLSSFNYICHFQNVTYKADDVFQPPVGHSQHNLQTELGLIHPVIPLMNIMLVEHTYNHSLSGIQIDSKQ